MISKIGCNNRTDLGTPETESINTPQTTINAANPTARMIRLKSIRLA